MSAFRIFHINLKMNRLEFLALGILKILKDSQRKGFGIHPTYIFVARRISDIPQKTSNLKLPVSWSLYIENPAYASNFIMTSQKEKVTNEITEFSTIE